MIKFVIFSFMAVAVCGNSNSSVTPEQLAPIRSKLLTIGLACILDYPLTPAEIKVLKNKVLPDSENAHCLAACVFKGIGIMDDMGYFNARGAINLTEQVLKDDTRHLAITEIIIQECTSVNDAPTNDGNIGCDRAKMLFNCLNNSADKYDFHIDF